MKESDSASHKHEQSNHISTNDSAMSEHPHTAFITSYNMGFERGFRQASHPCEITISSVRSLAGISLNTTYQ